MDGRYAAAAHISDRIESPRGRYPQSSLTDCISQIELKVDYDYAVIATLAVRHISDRIESHTVGSPSPQERTATQAYLR